MGRQSRRRCIVQCSTAVNDLDWPTVCPRSTCNFRVVLSFKVPQSSLWKGDTSPQRHKPAHRLLYHYTLSSLVTLFAKTLLWYGVCKVEPDSYADPVCNSESQRKLEVPVDNETSSKFPYFPWAWLLCQGQYAHSTFSRPGCNTDVVDALLPQTMGQIHV